MSSASVAGGAEIVRLCMERFNANDLEGFLELFDAEMEFHAVPEIPGSTVYRGHEGMRRWWKTVKDPLEQLRFEFGEATRGPSPTAT